MDADPAQIDVDGPGSSRAGYNDALLDLIAANFDHAFYAKTYPDVFASGMDMVRHYAMHGWRERRRPNTWFDSGWYLDAYPDIKSAGTNPLWHYVTAGAREGRLPRATGAVRREVVARAEPPRSRNVGYVAPHGAPILSQADAEAALAACCLGRRGLALAFSHDRYVDVCGGIQILLADEQRMFNGDQFAHVHLSPAISRLTLAPHASDGSGGPDPAYWVQVVIDGVFLGIVTTDVFARAVERAVPGTVSARTLSVHSLFGHTPAAIAALTRVLRPQACFAWVHDYATLCEGFHLLRNDVVFCHGPPPSSMACRVCIYGDTRAQYLGQLSDLFRSVPFRIVVPSVAALAVWRAGCSLPYLAVHVHPNCRLVEEAPSDTVRDNGRRPTRGTTDDPARVAFVGHPMAHKGWPLFQTIVDQCRGSGRYAFFHLAAEDGIARDDGLIRVHAQVSPDDRFATVAALGRAEIDLVVILSPWPETFCYVAFEAFAAGCDVIALDGSGNVPDAVRQHGRGVILADEPAMVTYFASGAAADHAGARAVRRGRLDLTGTTATIELGRDRPSGAPAPRSIEPDLQVYAGLARLRPERSGGDYRFMLPSDVGTVCIVSRCIVPALTDPPGTACLIDGDGGDRRMLGVAIADLRLDGQAVPTGDSRRLGGWHLSLADETGGDRPAMWTSGRAILDCAGARNLSFSVASTLSYVVSPLAALGLADAATGPS